MRRDHTKPIIKKPPSYNTPPFYTDDTAYENAVKALKAHLDASSAPAGVKRLLNMGYEMLIRKPRPDFTNALKQFSGILTFEGNTDKISATFGIAVTYFGMGEHCNLRVSEQYYKEAISFFIQLPLINSAKELKENCINRYIDLCIIQIVDGNKSDALEMLSFILQNSPQHIRASAIHKELITPTNRAQLLTPCIKGEYTAELDALITNHAKRANLSLPEQLKHILSLFDLLKKYFDFDKKPYTFLKENYTVDDIEDITSTPLSIEIANVLKLTPEKTKETSKKAKESILENGLDDLFFKLTIQLFRMIFETVHALPRESRNNFDKILPWGENSWFYLEVLGALFCHSHGDLSMAMLNIKAKNTASLFDQKKAIESFINSTSNYPALTKTALVSILKKDGDADALRACFQSLLDHNEKQKPIDKKTTFHDVPNLVVLINYFRYSLHARRILSLLPEDFPNGASRIGDIASELPQPTVASLLPSFAHHELKMRRRLPSFDSLKDRLAFLKLLESIGELFAARSLGSIEVDFIDPQVMVTIRNGLGHIEQLTQLTTIKNLENNKEDILKLRRELTKLRKSMVNYIINLQNKLPEWPTEAVFHQPFKKWYLLIELYWIKVKSEFGSKETNNQQLSADASLLPYKEIQEVLTQLQHENDRSTWISYLLGITPLPSQPTYDDIIALTGLTRSKDDRKKIKNLEKLIEKAYKTSSNFRLNTEKEASAKKKERDEELRKTRKLALESLPSIKELSIETAKNLKAKVPVSDIMQRLQDRVTLLKRLLNEESIAFDTSLPFLNQKNQGQGLKQKLKDDMELFLGCSYLTSQIISLCNTLSTAYANAYLLSFLRTFQYGDDNQKVEKYDFELFVKSLNNHSEKLHEWITFRNLSMHPDAIIESENISYYQVDFHVLPEALFYFIIDFLFTYEQMISNIQPSDLREFELAPSKHVSQERPFNLKSFMKASSTHFMRSDLHALFKSAPASTSDSSAQPESSKQQSQT